MPTMKPKYKTILTTAVSLCVSLTVLMLALYAGFSVAWFAEGNEATASGTGVTVAANTGASLRSYSIYKRDGTSARRVASSDDLVKTYVQMTEFDPIFIDRNVNTPIVVRLEIENIPDSNPDIIISTEADGLLFNSGKIDSEISNIVGARAAQLPTPTEAGAADLNTIDDTEADIIYSTAVEYFSNKTPATFVTLDTSISKNHTKSESLSVTVTGYTPKSDRSMVLYLEFDYIGDLVTAYVDYNGIQINSEISVDGKDMIEFNYDLTPFVVNYAIN